MPLRVNILPTKSTKSILQTNIMVIQMERPTNVNQPRHDVTVLWLWKKIQVLGPELTILSAQSYTRKSMHTSITGVTSKWSFPSLQSGLVLLHNHLPVSRWQGLLLLLVVGETTYTALATFNNRAGPQFHASCPYKLVREAVAITLILITLIMRTHTSCAPYPTCLYRKSVVLID